MRNAKLVFALIGGLSLPLVGFAADSESSTSTTARSSEITTDNKSANEMPAGSGSVSSNTGSSANSGSSRSGAQSAVPSPGAEGRAASPMFDTPMFDQLDTNKDGYVDSQESETSSTAKGKFTDLDGNRDGKISREEWSAGGSSDSSSSRRP